MTGPARVCRLWKWLAALMFASALNAHSAAAATVLEAKMAEVAGNVAAAIKGLGHDSVSIGAFTSPPQLEASSGPGIAKLLGDELAKLDVTVKRRAELGLKGDFRHATNDKGRLAARIDGELINRAGDVLLTFSTEVAGAQELSSLLGLTVELAADKPEKQREEKIAAVLEKPQATLINSRISASQSSPYAIELLIKSGDAYEPRAVSLDEGVAFVKLQRGEVYGVRVINESAIDAAVTLTIDGVNVFAFSEHKDYKHYIVAAKTSPVIKGWHRTNQLSDEFEVGEFSKSAAASLLPSGGAIGTITATFAAAWPMNQSPPADELSLGTRGDATIRGSQTLQDFTEVRRHTGRVRAAISVRYTKPDDLPPGEAP